MESKISCQRLSVNDSMIICWEPTSKIVHTFSIALVVRLASNTRASEAIHGFTTLFGGSGGGGGSQADGVLDCLHACYVVDWFVDRLKAGLCDSAEKRGV